MKKSSLFATSLVFVIAFGSPFSSFASTSIYPTGGNGYDISYNSSIPYPPTSLDFSIVGVTNGRAYGNNPNLQSEFAWAKLSSITPSLYMNLNAPVGSTVKGNISAPQACGKNDKVCQAYNYGYNAASSSYAYAMSQNASASTWWLDIETANSWSPNTAINDATIQGATKALKDNGVATVGIYSTQSMWNAIGGSAFLQNSGTPNWIPVGSSSDHTSACSQPFISGSPVWLVQYQTAGSSYDHDYSC